ncbi:MAG: hypothetical protein RL037_565 [Bacteroidota bacterium]
MNQNIIILSIFIVSSNFLFSQDTFSIVAVDSVTGEVGSAGASCVDLFQAGLPTDDFLGVLVPGVGAINTQAYYLVANQNNATNKMQQGLTPTQIIQWLVANDVQGNSAIRQYGITALINGSPQAAAHTGTATNNYKNHILGPNYSIQGNILLGQQILDSMESRFLAEEGDLACKLMAALQGANIIGADTRCAANGTSSLFAFVKVAQTTDAMNSPSFIASVRTPNNSGIEPIDSLQSIFSQMHSCSEASIEELLNKDKELVKIIDFMGRETNFKPNTALIFIYSDGTRERVIKLED